MTKITKNLTHAITGKIRLPSLQDYNVFVTWQRWKCPYEVNNIDHKTATRLGFGENIGLNNEFEKFAAHYDRGEGGVPGQENSKRYNIKGTYIIDQDESTGAIYAWHTEVHYFIRHAWLFLVGMPVHLAGLLGMAIIDAAGLIYSISTTLKALWCLNWHESATNGYQCLLRIASIGIKPLQWLGLEWSNILGMIDSRSGKKLYASLERGAYKEAFLASDFQPLTEKNGYIGETPVNALFEKNVHGDALGEFLCKSGAQPHDPLLLAVQGNTV